MPLQTEVPRPRYYLYPDDSPGGYVRLIVTPDNTHLWFLGICAILFMPMYFVLKGSEVSGIWYFLFLALALVLAALISAGAVGILVFLSFKSQSPRCPRCRKRVKIVERLIGLPVSVEVLRDPLNAEIVERLASGDCSPLDAAEPYPTSDEWIGQPVLFISFGSCERCAGPTIMLVEAHGSDPARNEVYLGELVFHREIDGRTAERLIDIAQSRSLITYGHEVKGGNEATVLQ